MFLGADCQAHASYYKTRRSPGSHSTRLVPLYNAFVHLAVSLEYHCGVTSPFLYYTSHASLRCASPFSTQRLGTFTAQYTFALLLKLASRYVSTLRYPRTLREQPTQNSLVSHSGIYFVLPRCAYGKLTSPPDIAAHAHNRPSCRHLHPRRLSACTHLPPDCKPPPFTPNPTLPVFL